MKYFHNMDGFYSTIQAGMTNQTFVIGVTAKSYSSVAKGCGKANKYDFQHQIVGNRKKNNNDTHLLCAQVKS
jgi:hypothetical protein